MRYRHSLRFRIIVSYLVFGIVIGGLLAVFLYTLLSKLEEQLVYDHVTDELQYFVELTEDDSSISTLSTKKLTGIKSSEEQDLRGYEFLGNLSSGVHEVNNNGRDYIVAATDSNGARYFMLYDVTDFIVQARFIVSILIGSLLFATAIAVWFGYWLSRRLIAPVTNLAQRVEALPMGDTVVEISTDFANDEVGRLAKAFEAYMKRIERFIGRERSFTAYASHELRTPIAIIQGALEIMLAEKTLGDVERRRLDRIDRAARDLEQSLSTLLILARDPESETGFEGRSDVAQVVAECIRRRHPQLNNRNVRVDVEIIAKPQVSAADKIVAMLVNNLISNALLYTPQGWISIRLEDTRLIIADSGIGIDSEDLPKVFEYGYRGKDASGSGSGFGLSIVKRICDRWGWQIRIDSQKGVGTEVVWSFGPTS